MTVAGRVNLNRYGQYMFGNQALLDLFSLLPKRYDYTRDDASEEE